MFFSFDGIDGVGKSTQLQLFCQWLRESGHDVIVCRDPGSTALGEQIRALVLGAANAPAMAPRSEMLLYMAARAQLVEEVIKPALEAGRIVVSDRYLLANIVYQGYAGGVELDAVRRVGDVATDGVMPSCTFLLDMDPALALARVDRTLDRIETRGRDYRERLRAGYLAEAQVLGPSVHVIAADHSPAVVQESIRQLALPMLAGQLAK